jgi:hypothetical protein
VRSGRWLHTFRKVHPASSFTGTLKLEEACSSHMSPTRTYGIITKQLHCELSSLRNPQTSYGLTVPFAMVNCSRKIMTFLHHRLATGWTVRGSNPGRGKIFRTRSDRPWGSPSLLCNGYRVSFTGVKRLEGWGGINNPPASSTTPPLGLHGQEGR